MGRRKDLLKIYEVLNGYFGDLRWWPAKSPFEVMVGAVLTQHTAWTNVEKAIEALWQRRLLTPAALSAVPEDELALLIRPSGYYRLKAKRLKALVQLIMLDYRGNIEEMNVEAISTLRDKLLLVNGIGPETADSILLYACKKPVFVSDAYTKRILVRHGMVGNDADYHSIQRMFMDNLPHDVDLFNQFHAMIVNTGKTFCRKAPLCERCPLSVLPA